MSGGRGSQVQFCPHFVFPRAAAAAAGEREAETVLSGVGTTQVESSQHTSPLLHYSGPVKRPSSPLSPASLA